MNTSFSSTRFSWISGLIGAVIVVVGSFIDSRQALDHSLLVLLAAGVAMFIFELFVRWMLDRENFVSISPSWANKEYGKVILEAFKEYALTVLFLELLSWPYGRLYEGSWYEWFVYMKKIIWIAGFPYLLLTNAFQYEKKKREGFSWENARTLFIKCFFIPVMSLFFVDQFFHAKGNWVYLSGLGEGVLSKIKVKDVYHVAITLIFTIDIGVAWCGYVFSSKWIGNQIRSTQPTLLGWVSALLCYPPFRMAFGYFFMVPSEEAFLDLQSNALVTVGVIVSLLTTTIYMASTLCFGLRFSNLTNRGIITNGTYAFVRHPAYAAKNLFWWFVMFPIVVNEFDASPTIIVGWKLVSMIALSGLYYLRAITEEKHLSADPEYVRYCNQVKHRFIPYLF